MIDWANGEERACESWQAMKIHLRRALGEKEWDMWIRHARLTRFSEPRGRYRGAILISMPRNGRVIFGAQRHLPRLRKFAGKLNYELCLTVQPDDYQVELVKERYGREWTYLEAAPSEMWK